MISSTINEHFLAIWRRAHNEPSLDALTPHLIATWAAARGLTSPAAEERDVGAFATTKCIVLGVGSHKACFPKMPISGDADWKLRKRVADKNATLWEKMEWFSPLWIPNDKVHKLGSGR